MREVQFHIKTIYLYKLFFVLFMPITNPLAFFALFRTIIKIFIGSVKIEPKKNVKKIA